MAKVNDRRTSQRATAARDGGVSVTESNAESIHNRIHELLKGFAAARMKKRDDAWTPLPITSPDHPLLEEIARSVTEGLIKQHDKREWKQMAARDLIVGDVVTMYLVVDGSTTPGGGSPGGSSIVRHVDEEVTVVSNRLSTDPTKRGQILTISRKSGGFREVVATPEWVFLVWRSTDFDDDDE